MEDMAGEASIRDRQRARAKGLLERWDSLAEIADPPEWLMSLALQLELWVGDELGVDVDRIRGARSAGWAGLDPESATWLADIADRLTTWLDGEALEFAEFTIVEGEHISDAFDASDLKAFVLTTRFAAAVNVSKHPESVLAHYHLTRVVHRRHIVDLDYARYPGPDGVDRMVIAATYDGLDLPVTIPASERGDLPDETHRSLFLQLREDLLAEP